MEKVIATNESNYGWEDFRETRTAEILLNDSTGALKLKISAHVKDTGINSYERNEILESVSLGTVAKPKLKPATSLLKKHSHSRSRASSPFKRKWRDAGRNERSLSEIVSEYRKMAPAGDDSRDEERKRREIMKKIQNISGTELDALLDVVRMGTASVSGRVASNFIERFGVEE